MHLISRKLKRVSTASLRNVLSKQQGKEPQRNNTIECYRIDISQIAKSQYLKNAEIKQRMP